MIKSIEDCFDEQSLLYIQLTLSTHAGTGREFHQNPSKLTHFCRKSTDSHSYARSMAQKSAERPTALPKT